MAFINVNMFFVESKSITCFAEAVTNATIKIFYGDFSVYLKIF